MLSRFAFLMLALVFGVAGCSTVPRNQITSAKAETDKTTENESPEELDRRAEAHARFLAGFSHDQNRQTEAALEDYEKSLAADPANESLAIDVARRYAQRRNWDKAIDVLKKAAAEPTASSTVLLRLATVYVQSGKTNDAIDVGRAAIKRQPQSIAGYQSLYNLYRQVGQTNEARKIVEQAARQPKPDAPFLVDLAHLFLLENAQAPKATNTALQARARAALDRAATTKPTDMVVLQKLAAGYTILGDTKKAADAYEKIVAQNPEVTGIRELLADIYLGQNDTTNATQQLEALVRENPTNPQAYWLLGRIAYDEQRFSEAVDHYRKTLLLRPNFEQVYYDLAAANMALEKPREALDFLAKAKERFRQSFIGESFSAAAYSQLANNKKKEGGPYLQEYTNALDHLTAAEVIATATDTNQLNFRLYFRLGEVSERTGDIPKAEQYFEKCLKLSPDFAGALNYLGYMWAERGTNLTRAREMIERAVKMDPTNAAYLDSLGWVLFKQGHFNDALDPIRKAVELAPEPDATLFDHLGDIYSAMNQPEKARDAWKKSLAVEPNLEIEKKLKSAIDPPASSSKK